MVYVTCFWWTHGVLVSFFWRGRSGDEPLTKMKDLLWKFRSKPNQTHCFGPGANSLPGCQAQTNTEEETHHTPGQGHIHNDLNISRMHLPGCYHLLAGDQAGNQIYSHGPVRIVQIQTVTHDSGRLS